MSSLKDARSKFTLVLIKILASLYKSNLFSLLKFLTKSRIF